jgi:hypothetical protein
VPPVEHAERAHVAFGHGDKQHLVARAAVHDLTVAVPGRKSFTRDRKFSGPVPSAKYVLANYVEHPLIVSLPEDAITGHVDRRPALEFASPDPWHQCRAGISDQRFPRTTGTPCRTPSRAD